MKFLNKIAAVMMSAVLAVPAGIAVMAEKDEDTLFEEYLKEEFKESVSSDYLTLQFTLKNPSAYGIEKPEATVGVIEDDDYQASIEEAAASLEKLESFDYDSLNEKHQHDYIACKFDLENSIALNTYEMFDWGFSPAEGLISNLITNFTEFPFRNAEDFDAYLDILESVPAYMDQVLELTKKQAEKGYFIVDSALDDTLDQIDRFTEKTEDNELIIAFEDILDEFEGLSEEKKQELRERNEDIVLNSYIPCYQKCAEELEKLRGSRSVNDGLYYLEGGEEYYAALVRLKTSSDKSVKELEKECESYIEDLIDEYIKLIRSNPDEEGDEVFPLTDPSEILSYLEEHLDQFPDMGEVSYQAKYLDPSVANDSTVAYYLNPPVDDPEENQIKINGSCVSEGSADLYTTLAHEGMPGHLYQNNYYLSTQPSELRTMLNMIGYSEGWAMYAEMEALSFSGMEEVSIKMQQLDTSISYVLDAMVDLGVNGLGWTVDDVAAVLDNLGLNSAIADSLMDFVCENPGTILPYGVGLTEFALLRRDAEKALGTSFDEKEYHEVLLYHGPRPFSSVKADLNTYIEEKKGGGTVPAEPDTPEEFKVSNTTLIFIAVIGIVALIALLVAVRSRRKDPFR